MTRRLACGLLLTMAVTSGAARAQTLSPGISTENPVVYKIKMTTTFAVPVGNQGIDELRAWHALPTRRPWSMGNKAVGASEIVLSPGGIQEYEKEHDSHHVYWRKAERLMPGKTFTFVSQFTVSSLDREFHPDRVKVQWQDYAQPSKDPAAKVDPNAAKNVHPEVAALADRLKKTIAPDQAVPEFCKWIKDRIRYDASVSYPWNDVASTVKNCRGHCGHQYAVLEQLCTRSGIPIRLVFGLNLYEPKGRGQVHAVRPDYSNIHTWAEVYFPGIGWVEVEPNNGEKAYLVPARLIQNNKWFQNYSLWFREDGQQKQHFFIYREGKYVSPYGVDHLITYTIEK